MESKTREGMASSKKKKLLRLSRIRNQNDNTKDDLMEDAAKVKSEGIVSPTLNGDGVVRMKIVVRKQDLGELLRVIRGGKSDEDGSRSRALVSAEERLNFLKRKHLVRKNGCKEGKKRSWRPQLHTIPEEL